MWSPRIADQPHNVDGGGFVVRGGRGILPARQPQAKGQPMGDTVAQVVSLTVTERRGFLLLDVGVENPTRFRVVLEDLGAPG